MTTNRRPGCPYRVLCGRAVTLVLLSFLLMLAGSTTAYAYIDPGTGMMAIQAFIAMIAGALFYFTQFRNKLKEHIGNIIARFKAKRSASHQ